MLNLHESIDKVCALTSEVDVPAMAALSEQTPDFDKYPTSIIKCPSGPPRGLLSQPDRNDIIFSPRRPARNFPDVIPERESSHVKFPRGTWKFSLSSRWPRLLREAEVNYDFTPAKLKYDPFVQTWSRGGRHFLGVIAR